VVNLLNDWERVQPRWDEFVRAHPKGSAFHTSEMVQVWEAAKGYSPLPLAAVGSDGEILSLLVAARVQTLPNVFGAVSSRSVWYAEPLCLDDEASVDSLCSIISEHDRLMRRRVLFTEVRPLHAAGPERVALERCGYKLLDYLNYVIDTRQPKELLWKRVRESFRTNMRKCERQGFEIKHYDDSSCVGALYDILKITYGRADVPLAHRSLFDAAYRILAPKGMIHFMGVQKGDEVLGLDAMLLFEKQVFGWYGGSIRMKGRSPGAYMQWQEITWSCDRGFGRYDFGGAGWPDIPYGVRDFKAGFGGDLVCYGRYRKVFSRWKMALAERAYELGRTVISPKDLSR
jgi:CelD/BcsL family acetyltransferase involved in cellulose biosynthesis